MLISLHFQAEESPLMLFTCMSVLRGSTCVWEHVTNPVSEQTIVHILMYRISFTVI